MHPILQAFKTRLEGNELFKSGDYRAALLKYHAVLVALRGVYWPAGGAAHATASSTSSPAGSDDEAGEDLEASEGEGEDSNEGKGKGKAPVVHEPAKEAPKKTRPDDENMAEQIKQALKNTYLNSAAIYVKQERWSRALESAKAAQKFEENNPKAKYREGQALIGLGRLWEGKRLLEELMVTNPDSAVTAALVQVAEMEAKREMDRQKTFRGMFDRGTPSSKKEQQADTAAGPSFSFGAPSSSSTKEKQADPAGAASLFSVPPSQEAAQHLTRPLPSRRMGPSASPKKRASRPGVSTGAAPKKEDGSDSAAAAATAHASTSKGDSPTAQVTEDVKNVAIEETEPEKLVVEDEQA
ncbi:hypothetical protein JCM8208_002234 [Rhodotorula glutinis]